jgi:cell division septum initiation protein DivIVA
MSRASIERRLIGVSDEIRALRDRLRVLDEQLNHFVDAADEARLRSLVSETPLAAGEHREAAKTVVGLRRDRDTHMRKLTKLEAKQDALLDQLGQVMS